MKFVVDQQLPPSLARWLEARGHEATHVQDRGFGEASDSDIWALALAESAVVVSKDTDFAQRRAVSATGPSIIWLRIGNTTNPALLRAMERAWPAVESALQAGVVLVEVW